MLEIFYGITDMLETIKNVIDSMMNVKKGSGEKVSNPQQHSHHLHERAKRNQFASELCDVISDVGIRPESLCDVGCGYGFFLAAAQKKWDVVDILGVDGDWVGFDEIEIPRENFLPKNLEKADGWPDRTFDLAASLEVGEHLSPSSADLLVERLAQLSDVVLFSAAIPGQGGQGHQNEQYMDYWAKKFEAFGRYPVDVLHERVWANKRLPYWFRQNLIIFASAHALEAKPIFRDYLVDDFSLLRRVHPFYYEKKWKGEIRLQ